HHHRLLRAALQQAVKWQMLARNPADFVDPPRVARAEMQAVDERGAVGFLKAAEGTTVYLPMLVAVTTGMRRGEVLGLRWEDVDLKAGTLTVRQALGQSRAGLEFKQPKTTKSRRVIELPALLVEALVRHKGEQAKEKLLMGAAYQSLGLLFAHPDGRPIQPDHLSKLFAKLAKQAGSPLRFNGLRHSHASQLLKQGESVKVVSERLGHADASTTLRVYSHVLPGMGRAAASRMDAALREAMGEDEGGAVSESA
ncbi:MAG TPA: site-specific integrase, partial [Armatimonadota bacterium]|nr:site-specific integrase [Armatimonadota bacterium]